MTVPFTIRCVSCNGRLRVTDESIVGSILGCPRCGSMVQIDAPPSVATPNVPVPPPMVLGEEAVDSQEMTQDEVLGPSPAPPSPAPPSPDENTARPDVAPANRDASEESDWQSDGDWTSEPSRRIRKRVMIGVAATGGLLVAGILVAWGLSGSTNRERLVQQDSVNQEPAGEISAPQEGSPSPDEPDTETLPGKTTQPAATESSAAESSATPVQTTPISVADQDTRPTRESGGSGRIPSDLLPPDVLGDANANSPRGNAGNSSNDRIIPNAAADAPAEEPLMDLPPELQAFTMGLFDLPGAAPDALTPSAPDAGAAELMVEQAADAAIDPMLLATPPPEVNVENALKLGVAIQTDGYPLASFVLACSELTTLPIQIDWVTLDLAGVSVSQKIRDSKPGFKPIGSLIDAIAVEAGVVFEREETRLFLTLSEPDFLAQVQTVVSLDDFGDEKEATKKWVARFVESTQWNERERLGLRALVTDSLRRARSMATRLPEPARAHWTVIAECLPEDVNELPLAVENFPERWPLLQGGDSGPQLDTSITLAGLLRQTSRRNATTCVVNWDDARQRRLSPGQLVMPFAGQPAGEMLTETLAPMGLQIRVADESHWWVGTAATYDRMPLLVIGDALGPRRDEILQRIDDAAQRAGTLVLIQHDPVSDRYLSLMPRYLYRQLPTILKPFRQPASKAK